MTLDEFDRTVSEIVERSSICDVPMIVVSTEETIRIRIELFTGGFIEAYHNQRTDTTSYVLIQHRRRLFAVDNTGGWHCHPFHDPTLHEPLKDEMSFAEFLAEVEQAVG